MTLLPEELKLYCEHTKEDETDKRIYRVATIGKNALILCRACYGELLVQILEDLKTIRLETKTKW